MAKYLLFKKAVDDLSAIWRYTCETWAERQADRYYYMHLETCQDLADGTLSGKPYPEISGEISGFKGGQHLIFTGRQEPLKLKLPDLCTRRWI